MVAGSKSAYVVGQLDGKRKPTYRVQGKCLLSYIRCMQNITIKEFHHIDLRVGTIVSAELFAQARKPAYKLSIDFGDLGIKQSSAQITLRYTAAYLVGKQIIAVVNFPYKRIAGFKSEVLVLGATPTAQDVVLLQPETPMPNGAVVG